MEATTAADSLNLRRYSDASVVAEYAARSDIIPVEQYLFSKYIRRGDRVLDVGVGGGRTTVALAPIAGRYLGIDYAPAMVSACRKRFPSVAFEVADATALTSISDESFDVAVFSASGLDCLPEEGARVAALREFGRVVRPGGLVIFCSHNALMVGAWPVLHGASVRQRVWRAVRALALAPKFALSKIMAGALWRGRGYVRNRVHGGLRLFTASRRWVGAEITAAELEVVEVVGSLHPQWAPAMFTPTYHYVARRSAAARPRGL